MIYFPKLGQYGRLGNCLFQLAATIGTAYKYNLNYRFPYWQYMNFFNLPSYVWVASLNTDKYPIYNEPYFHYQEIPKIDNEMNIHGYFQSPKYWEHCKENIVTLLRPKNKFLDTLIDCTAIHVRRTDYLIHKDCYNILDKNYYNEAMNLLPSEKYIIFSDDISWCKSIFIGNKFIFSEERDAFMDWKKMLCCKNFIIANSSYSWWAAYLNNNPEKTIIAPKNWFGPKLETTHDTKDLIPPKWIAI